MGAKEPHRSRAYAAKMAQTVEALLRGNMHGVFGEHDAQERRNNIARLWAEDGVFTDQDSFRHGHSGIDDAATELVGKFPSSVFRERSIQAFNGIGKIDRAFGPAGEAPVVTGSDVLVVKGDKMRAMYTFLDAAR